MGNDPVHSWCRTVHLDSLDVMHSSSQKRQKIALLTSSLGIDTQLQVKGAE